MVLYIYIFTIQFFPQIVIYDWVTVIYTMYNNLHQCPFITTNASSFPLTLPWCHLPSNSPFPTCIWGKHFISLSHFFKLSTLGLSYPYCLFEKLSQKNAIKWCVIIVYHISGPTLRSWHHVFGVWWAPIWFFWWLFSSWLLMWWMAKKLSEAP